MMSCLNESVDELSHEIMYLVLKPFLTSGPEQTVAALVLFDAYV